MAVGINPDNDWGILADQLFQREQKLVQYRGCDHVAICSRAAVVQCLGIEHDGLLVDIVHGGDTDLGRPIVNGDKDGRGVCSSLNVSMDRDTLAAIPVDRFENNKDPSRFPLCITCSLGHDVEK